MSYIDENISLVRANTSTEAFDSGVINENTVDAYANLFYPYLLDNGGNTKNIGLTIDILNKSELEQNTKDIVNKRWVSNNRLDNTVSVSKAIWGFKEAFHGVKKSRALSNSFCFAGQEITFYIAPQGHLTGHIDNQWVYAKTSVTISAVDIVNGTNDIIYTFNEFEKDSLDSDRYFNWTVPSLNNDAYNNYSLFGLVVLKIKVENTYYSDAKLENEIEEAIPYENQSHLQLLIYSGAKEIIEVNAGDIDILNTTPSYTDLLAQIFNDTVFEDIQDLNENTLTDAQKRAIIADQIAVLFISQHPVLTADYYPGKIIGSGANESIFPKKVIDKAIVYSKKHPDIIPMVNDRLFGMIATYKAFNFAVDIEKYISDFTQSSQFIRDPVRTIYIDEDGNTKDDLGINGLIFNPYVLSVRNAEVVKYFKDSVPIDMLLQDGLVDIHNIQILDETGTQLPQPYSSSVRVSFDVAYGSESIKYIRYSVFTQEKLNYKTYTDLTGLTRSHVFNLDNEILPRPNTRGDVVSCQIDIEDVEGGIASFVYSLSLHGYEPKPTLHDLRIYQRKDGSKIVDICYTYDGLGEINNSYLYVQFSSDNGVNWSDIPIESLKGDFGQNIMPGKRKVTWIPEVDLKNIELEYPILCRLTLYDVDDNMATGNVLTGALVHDIVAPEVFIKRI